MKLLTFCAIVLCVVSILEAGTFFEAKGTEYFISYPLRKNWFKAQRFCTYHGLHMVSLHSFEEEQTVLSVIKRFKTKYNITKRTHIHLYMSGSDLGHVANEFYWTTTGLPMVYTNWRNGYPPIARSKPDLSLDCVILDDEFELKWVNLSCDREYFFMCQNRINAPQINRTNNLINCQLE